MKKTEGIIAVEDFLSVNGIDINKFYSIRIDNYDIALQGKFSDLSANVCQLKIEIKVNDLGHAVGEMMLPVSGFEETIKIRIILT